MPKPHAAAVRAVGELSSLTDLITREYEPLVKAVRNVRDAAIQYGWLAAVNELNAALREVCGDD